MYCFLFKQLILFMYNVFSQILYELNTKLLTCVQLVYLLAISTTHPNQLQSLQFLTASNNHYSFPQYFHFSCASRILSWKSLIRIRKIIPLVYGSVGYKSILKGNILNFKSGSLSTRLLMIEFVNKELYNRTGTHLCFFFNLMDPNPWKELFSNFVVYSWGYP